jgi:hypothetical protein
MRVYSEREFENESLQCPRCGWSGKGEDAHVVDFYGISRVMEAHCPGCDKQLGNIRRPERSGRSRPGGPESFDIS